MKRILQMEIYLRIFKNIKKIFRLIINNNQIIIFKKNYNRLLMIDKCKKIIKMVIWKLIMKKNENDIIYVIKY